MKIPDVRHLATAIAIVCAASACHSLAELTRASVDRALAERPLPPNAERLEPPAVYARWWAMTEACSGRSGSFAAVRWYRVPGSLVLKTDADLAGAYWDPVGNRIVLGADMVDRGEAIRHEMLHSLLGRGKHLHGPSKGHPRDQFLEKCAALVSCGYCEQSPEPWQPPPDYVTVPPDSLEITTRTELLPRESDGQRWLSVRVTARNPRPRAVRLTPTGGALKQPTFSYEIRGPRHRFSDTNASGDSSALFFEPFGTKGWLFEFLIHPDPSGYPVTYRLPPGEYVVRGGFALRMTAAERITVSP